MKGRIRTIKPEIALDEELWRLCRELPDAPVFQIYTMLWCLADREERFEWRPFALRALCCPYWEGEMDDVLRGLERYGKILRYEVDGKSYGIVKNLKIHQAFNSREPVSRLPPPPGIVKLVHAHACTRTHAHAQEERNREQGTGNGTGNREQGMDPATPGQDTVESAQPVETTAGHPDNPPVKAPTCPPEPRRGDFRTLAPQDWSPSDPGVAYAVALGLSPRDIDDTIVELRNWKGTRAYTIDWWDRKWNSFVENRAKWRAEGPKSRRAPKMGEPGWQRQPNTGALDLSKYELHDDSEAANG